MADYEGNGFGFRFANCFRGFRAACTPVEEFVRGLVDQDARCLRRRQARQ